MKKTGWKERWGIGVSGKLKINAPECNYPHKIGIIIAPNGAIRNKLDAIGRFNKKGKIIKCHWQN